VSERWEYMTIVFIASQEPKKWPSGRISYSQRQDLEIWRPGDKDPELIPLWSSEDESVTGSRPRALLNEYGAEGWELASDVVTESAVGKTQSGWERAGFPIRREWVLKRRAVD